MAPATRPAIRPAIPPVSSVTTTLKSCSGSTSAIARSTAYLVRRCRSALSWFSREAILKASRRSSVRSSSRAGRGFFIRPMELMRGPSLHPRSFSSISPLTPATLASASMPGRAPPAVSPC